MPSQTKTQVEQRLRKLEADILPPPRVPFSILHMPPDDAGPAAWAAYRAALASARQQGAKVCVVTDCSLRNLDGIDGVTYVNNLWEAELNQLANAPSDHGRPNKLHDLFAMLRRSARVIGPDPAAAQPAEEEDDSGRPVAPAGRIDGAQPQVRWGRWRPTG